jgi:serine protease AprX
MPHILRVFAEGERQDAVVERSAKLGLQVVERYRRYVLLESSDPAPGLGQGAVVEDLTRRYSIPVGGSGGRTIDTSLPRLDRGGVDRDHPAYGDAPPLPEGRHHYLVQCKGPIKPAWREGLIEVKAEPRGLYGEFTLVVRADKEAIDAVANLSYVRWVGYLQPGDRIVDPSPAAPGPGGQTMANVFTVAFFDPDDAAAAQPRLRDLPGVDVLADAPDSAVRVVRLSGGSDDVRTRLREVASVGGVREIHRYSIGRLSNDVATTLMGTATAIADVGDGGLGLSGFGERVAICDSGFDTGRLDDIHPDFCDRVVDIRSFPVSAAASQLVANPQADDGGGDSTSGHGTHVAGSVLGDGKLSTRIPGLARPIRGLAHRATLYFQAVQQAVETLAASAGIDPVTALAGLPDDPTELFTDAANHGARIFVMAWERGETSGAYDDQCAALDRFVWENPEFLAVVAAGNNGRDLGDGEITGGGVLPLGTAKNCITVGGCESQRPDFAETYQERFPDSDFEQGPYGNEAMARLPDRVTPFSSRGPTESLLHKPEVVAPSTFVLSVRSRALPETVQLWAPFAPSPRDYAYLGGTSQAAALVGGAAALVREYLRTQWGIAAPTAALVKAALIAGATRLPDSAAPGAIVDDIQGYGRVNLDAVLAPAAPTSAAFLERGPLADDGVFQDELIVGGAVPLRVVMVYTDPPAPVVVNHLNLSAQGPRREPGDLYLGNRGPGETRLPDFYNNVEVVHVERPEPGSWRIEVAATNIQGPQAQPFALVYLGDFRRAANPLS